MSNFQSIKTDGSESLFGEIIFSYTRVTRDSYNSPGLLLRRSRGHRRQGVGRYAESLIMPSRPRVLRMWAFNRRFIGWAGRGRCWL